VGGWLYDRYGSYAWMYLGSLAVGTMAAVMALQFRSARATQVARLAQAAR
jgi:hypothetical protein